MYYQKIGLGVAACVLISVLPGASERWAVEARESIHHVFSRDNTIDVDAINGTIEIIGDNESTMRVEGEKIIRGREQGDVEQGKREISLDINEKDGVAQLYVNGPFRHHEGAEDHGFHEHFDRHYEVTYNLTIHVPHQTALQLRTVNGKIQSSGTAGRFDVHDVNGSVAMAGLAGSGSVRTVNGEVTVAFLENPKAPSEFSSVNGKIDATFAPGLSADIRTQTLNGGAFTDFESTILTPQPAAVEKRNGRTVIKADKATRVRIGNGGPELNFQTVNGSISIRKGNGK